MRNIGWMVLVAVFLSWNMVAGCGEAPEDKVLVQPVVTGGKADVSQGISMKGLIPWGSAEGVAGAFTRDLEFHGYTFVLGDNSNVTVEVTLKGSSKNIDTTLFLYGPAMESGRFGSSALAHDDDSGWGRLSRIRALEIASGGEYLIVVGTATGMGRGNYRLVLTCNSADCLPPVQPEPMGACLPSFALAIDNCIAGHLADDPQWASESSRRNLVEQCADIEILAPAYDALCAVPVPDNEFCGQSLDEVDAVQTPACLMEAWHRQLDAMCVFGTRYAELFESGALVVMDRRTLTVASLLSPLEEAQVVAAMGPSAYADVTNAQSALESVDGGQINQVEVWDASNRQSYIIYEYGAGDNSYGMIFSVESVQGVVTIQDGDLVGCSLFWGPERRDCSKNDDCAQGLTCVGVAEYTGRGRCINTQATEHPALESECTLDSRCPKGSGLQCHGVREIGEQGLCRPAWMTGHFFTIPDVSIPDNDSTGVDIYLVAYGLTTVDVLILIDLQVSHSRPSDLIITLTNPIGTESMVLNGSEELPEIFLSNHKVNGFSGDEPVNGLWKLNLRDTKAGHTGYVGHFGLTVTSRWD